MLIRDIEVIPAIIDLVDNSADGAKRLRPEAGEKRYEGLWVDIEVSPQRFVIRDNCGGMDVDLARDYAFRFGRIKDKGGPIGEVGQFGIGMKRSLFKLGEKFIVESATAKNRFSLPVVVSKWMEEPGSDWSFRFDRLEENIKVPQAKQGTNIVVEGLHDLIQEDFGQTRFINRLRRDIAVRELRLLQQGLDIKVNDTSLKASEPILLASKELSPIHVERELAVNGSKLRLQLWAGLAEVGWR